MRSFNCWKLYKWSGKSNTLGMRTTLVCLIMACSYSYNFAQESTRRTGPTVKNKKSFVKERKPTPGDRIYFPKGPAFKNRKKWLKVYDMGYKQQTVTFNYRRITGVKAKQHPTFNPSQMATDSLVYMTSQIRPYIKDSIKTHAVRH